MSKELNKALDLLREIRPSIPKDVLELWCKDRDAFLASHKTTVEQAGGDERVKCAACVDSGKVYDISGEGPWKCYACTGSHEVIGYANGDELDNMLDDRTAVLSPVKTSFHTVPVYRQARAALAIASSAQTEHERDMLGQALGECIEAAGITTPGTPLTGPQLLMFAKDLKRDLKRAALAQPSPKCATCNGSGQVWISDEPQRHFEDCPDCAQPSPVPTEGFTHFPELLESVQQMDAMLKANSAQAEAERPEVVAWRYGFSGGIVSDKACLDEWKSGGEYQSLMTVAQHERIVGALRAKLQAAEDRADTLEHRMMGMMTRHFAETWRNRDTEKALDGYLSAGIAQLEQNRDAALARGAELDKQCRDDVARALGLRPSQDRGFAWSYLLASIKSCVKASEDADQAQHSVPEGWRLVPVEQLLNMMSDKDHDTRIMAERQLLAVLAAAPGTEVPQAWLDVQAERRRQVTAEGWTPEHDDEHNGGELADAAACYALWAGGINPGNWREFWPWAPEWLKHSEPRRMLVKAGALILAEIERLDRAATGKEGL
ncbi:hypothetical protein QK430_27310 [Pseudomonas aeruginosa]|nr:hypothetical protein [Pseudomonas aeruginosa]MDI3993117.1 hypothetical protein [Pseudomonas aeruginosa]